MITDPFSRNVDGTDDMASVANAANVNGALRASSAFAQLEPEAQRELAESFAKIAGYLGAPHGRSAAARQLAPDLSSLRRDGGGQAPAQAPTGAPGGAPAGGAPVAGGVPAAAPGGSVGATGRVGDVTKATLSAIDFPSFVASLIQGTFQAIVDASIQQMEAYAQLLKNAALTVDQFMSDNVTDGTARDYLADRFEGVFQRDTQGTSPRLRVRDGGAGDGGEIPSFFKGLGLDSLGALDDDTVEQKVVPATRRMLAEQRQQTLATMVLMGINRVVVSDGEISAKLQFHVDASETTQMRFDQQKTSGMNLSGTAGRNPFSAQGIMVNTASVNAQSALNVRADLVGNVVVRFRSETFPLERFADSAAIQLINSRAKVPAPAQASPSSPQAQGPQPGAGAPPPPAVTTPPSLAPAPAPGAPAPATPRAQSWGDDLWGESR
ncbi:hypothetical protein [Pendulispora albinea]|uniref:Uncharacterized protein n=1 Tax=Pendulispora albinea TaxID=2741071 RepID=A0ABZ2M2A5_9BACT